MSTGPVATASVQIVPNLTGFRAALQAQLAVQMRGVTAQVHAQVAGTAAAANAAALSGVRGGVGRGAGSGAGGINALTKESQALRGALIGLSRVTPVTVFGLGLYGTAAIAAGYAIKGAIRSTADFEHQLNVFQATTGATGDEMIRVKETAKALGADLSLPSTSAGDAALALTELAKSGLSVDESLAGVRGTLQLAAAASIDVGTAANFVATELNAFGLAGNQATHIADLLAGASIAAQGDIRDFGTAFQQVSAVSRQVGLSVETTTGALTELAKAGLRGADGGTSLRTTLLRLAPTTKQAAEYQKALGIEIDNTRSIGKQLPELIDQYRTALSALTPVQQQQALAQIFGQDAIRAASILIREGSEGLRDNTTAANLNGAASDLAAANAKGLSGAFNGLKSNLDTLGITLGDFVKGPLTDAVNLFSAGVGHVNDFAVALGNVDIPDWLGGGGTASAIKKGALGFFGGPFGAALATASFFTGGDKEPQGPGEAGFATGVHAGRGRTAAIQLTPAEKKAIRDRLKALQEDKERKKPLPGDVKASNALQIAQLDAQLADDLKAELKADVAIEHYFTERLKLAKKGSDRYVEIKNALASAHSATASVQSQIESEAKSAAAEAKAKREEAKRVAEDAARDAAERAKDLFNLQKSRLDLAIDAAGLTKGIKDDVRTNRAEITFFNAQIKRINAIKKRRKLTLEEQQAVVDYRTAIIGLRSTIKGLLSDKDKGGFTLGELFQEASDAFKTFGSNINARNGVLSAQDERASFGKDLLDQRKPGGLGQATLTEAQKQTMLLRVIADRLRIPDPTTKEAKLIAKYPVNASRAWSRARVGQESGAYT